MSTDQHIKTMFLALPRATQLSMLSESPSIGIFLQLSKIALDAPLNEGGIPTEDIRIIATQLGYDDYEPKEPELEYPQ